MLSCMWLNRESWLVLSILTLVASFLLQSTVLGAWMRRGYGREGSFRGFGTRSGCSGFRVLGFRA